MTIRDAIAQYLAFFKARNQAIAGIADATFKEVLYLVEIDTLSRAAFPTIVGHRKRVVRFIDTCSGWQDKDRVSAVQLKLALEGEGIRSGQLYDSVNRRINAWGYGLIIRPEDDLTLGEVLPLATPRDRSCVTTARYAELLYMYRNYVVHEFRTPGQGIDLGDDLPPTPYYIGTDCPGGGQNSWELVFPGHFLHGVCDGCLSGLEVHLITNNLNPYDAYDFGPMWRRPPQP